MPVGCCDCVCVADCSGPKPKKLPSLGDGVWMTGAGIGLALAVWARITRLKATVMVSEMRNRGFMADFLFSRPDMPRNYGRKPQREIGDTPTVSQRDAGRALPESGARASRTPGRGWPR